MSENDKQCDVMNNIVELNEENFEREVLAADGPVLVDFYAPWCGPCRMLAPVLEHLAGEFEGNVKFAKLDVDDAPGQAGIYGITGVPTLMLYREGRAVDQVVGLASPNSLKAWIARIASEPAAV